MDEQTLERMVGRSFVSIRHKEPLFLSAAALFLAGLFWQCSRAVLGQYGGPLYAPFLMLSLSLTFLPLLPLISPLALFILSYRKQEEPLSLLESFKLTWKPSLALFVQGVVVLVVEMLLTTVLLLWSFFEALPVLGPIFYLFTSWGPSILSFIMLLALMLHVFVACFLGTILVVHPVHAKDASWSDLAKAFSTQWFLRLKLLFVGLFPTFFLLTFLTGWGSSPHIGYAEFCASVFRLAVFSFFFAPFFIFLVHMAVEAERYSIWRSRNKS